MAIQTRGGNEADFDPNKMLPKEVAGTLDTKKVFYTFGPGDCRRLATHEEMTEMMSESLDGIKQEFTADIEQSISDAETATENANTAATNAQDKADYADLKGQEAQSIVESAGPIINQNLQASYADKGTITEESAQFPTADDGLIALTSIKGKTTVTPADPLQDISPDNPATITGAGDADFDVVACGKNLINIPEGTVTGGNKAYYIYGIKVGDTITLTLSQTLSVIGSTFNAQHQIKFLDFNGNTISQSNICMMTFLGVGDTQIKSQSKTAPNGTFSVMIDIGAYYGSAPTLITNYTQLELGSTSTPYEPYKSNKLTISGLPMNDLPDGTCDEIVQVDDGSWKHIQRVGKVVFDGSETWTKSTTSAILNICDRFILKATSIGAKAIASCLFSHFEFSGGGDTTAIGEGYLDSNRNLYFNFSAYNTTTLEQWKTWLSQNPVTVYYELATPIETPLDIKLYLTSYKGITNVYTTANPQVEFTAVAKSELWSREYLINLGIKALQDGKIDKTAITSQSSTNDANKVPSSQVTHAISVDVAGLQTSVTNLNNNLNNLDTLKLSKNAVQIGWLDWIRESGLYVVENKSYTPDDTQEFIFRAEAQNTNTWVIWLTAYQIYADHVYMARMISTNGTTYTVGAWHQLF